MQTLQKVINNIEPSERDGVSPANKLYITTFISGITITRLVKPPAAPTDLSGFWSNIYILDVGFSDIVESV